MSGLTLFAIEDALLQLAQAREELTRELENVPMRERHPDTIQAELAEVDKALAEYAQCREPAKVDSIHGLLKHWKLTAEVARQEAREFQERAQRIEANEKRLKAMVCDIMAAAGKKRLEGTGGRYLSRRGNGGMAPLVVQEDVLPSSYRDVSVKISRGDWNRLMRLWAQENGNVEAEPIYRIVLDEPSNERIRAALAAGENVPGARLDERGEHVECR